MKRLLMILTASTACVASAARIELRTAGASCTVETKGARILSYATAAGGETLWNDDPVQTEAADWANGGIPVCWPWFSRGAGGKMHGFAWEREFKVLSRKSSPERSEAVLLLETPEATLTYTVLLRNEALKLTLETRNVSAAPYRFSAALHPYFKVGELTTAWLEGVGDKPFRFTGARDGNVPCPKGSDRLCRLTDPTLKRTLSLAAGHVDGICVWTPGSDPANLAGTRRVVTPDAWRRFVCVEPTVGYPGKITLAPGASHVFSYELRPSAGAVVPEVRPTDVKR